MDEGRGVHETAYHVFPNAAMGRPSSYSILCGGNTMKKISLIGLLLVLLVGCAEKGPIVLDVSYQPPATKSVAAPKVVIGVAPFKDDRANALILGKRKIADDVQDDFVVAGASVSGLVTERVKDAFKARGFVVKDSAWDRTEAGIKDDGADILISGEIKALNVDSVALPLFKTNTKAVVQMKIVAADKSEKKVIRTLALNSTVEQEGLYSREKVGAMISEALSSALDQIFKDEELNKKLK
jgi:galactitol-specific phosphotransferase system IIB component